MFKKIIRKNIWTAAGCLWVAFFCAMFFSVFWGWKIPLFFLIILFFLGNMAVAGIIGLLARCDAIARINGKLTDFVCQNLTDRELFFLIWLIILIPWIFAYLALFPGTFGYDVPLQAAQFFGYGGMGLASDHPVAHTLLVGCFLAAGNKVLGSYTAGFALFTAFQMLMVTGCAARSLVYLKRRRAPIPVILAGAIWTAWDPALQILGLNATKDILFGVFLLHFSIDFLNCMEAARGGDPKWIRLSVSAVLMGLFRNQGIYILLVLIAVLLIFRIRSKSLYRALISAFAVCGLFFAFCNHIVGMEAGDKREMLSLPMQQTAYVCHFYLNGDSRAKLTEEQFQTVREVIPDESVMENMSFDTADPVKAVFRTKVLFQDFPRHMKNYLKIGMQNPKLYWEETVNMLLPYWDMTLNEYCELAVRYTFSEMDFLEIRQQSYLEPYYDYLTDISLRVRGHFWLRTAGAGLWLLVLLFGIAIARRDKIYAMGCMPVTLYVFTMLLGPVALLRYLFPIMLATPLLFGIMFTKAKKEGGSGSM